MKRSLHSWQTVKTVRFYAEHGLLGTVPRAGAYRTSKITIFTYAAFVLDPDGHNIEAVVGGVQRAASAAEDPQ